MAEEFDEDLSEEERAVLNEVIKAGDDGIYPDEIAQKLNMPVEKVEEILDNFEKEGWFYSDEEED